ncbi:MAG: methylmalonyl-CoA carboxyltransferase [Oscillospiraceae bacterium]|nr:methylmalonyl-CoA carboxyltransferase [Oscillospiraceae bacterium]
MHNLDTLRAEQEKILSLGGKDKIEKQHNLNKMTARERINALIDEGTFVELDAFAQQRGSIPYSDENLAADGVVCGYGAVNNRQVCVFAQDFTVIGASLGEVGAEKIVKVMELAAKTGIPVIGLAESAGIRLSEGLDALCGLGKILKTSAKISGVVPQILSVMGPLAGIFAALSPLCDFTLVTEKNSTIFLNGPQVVKGSTNDDVTAENLGGAKISAKFGKAQIVCEDDADCIEKIKKILDYIPDNNLGATPFGGEADDINRTSEMLNSVNSENLDIRTVINEICDASSVLELSKDYAPNVVTAFAYLGGESAAIVAASGELDIAGCKKAARFVSFADSFNIPVVTLTNVSGFKAERKEEDDNNIAAAADLISAYSEATTAKIDVIIGSACGGAYLAMGSKYIGSDMTIAWPGAEISVLNSSACANIMFKDDIAKSDDPKKERDEKIAEYKENNANPYIAAKRGYVDNIIEPALTRPVVISALEMLAGKRESGLSKKHKSN